MVPAPVQATGTVSEGPQMRIRNASCLSGSKPLCADAVKTTTCQARREALHSFAHENPVGLCKVGTTVPTLQIGKLRPRDIHLSRVIRLHGQQTLGVPSSAVCDSKAWLLITFHTFRIIFIPQVLVSCCYCNKLPQTC